MSDSEPKLNSDVYAHLLSFVSSPADLLAVSLANKELFALGEPELIYRSIACRLDRDDVWEHLIANPARASRVRHLELLSGANMHAVNLSATRKVPPRAIRDLSPASGVASREWFNDRKMIEKSELLLIRAIKFMVNLESFTWDRWPPAVNVGLHVWSSNDVQSSSAPSAIKAYDEDVWTALRDNTHLKALRVVDLGRRESLFPGSPPIFNSSVSSPRALVTFYPQMMLRLRLSSSLLLSTSHMSNSRSFMELQMRTNRRC